MRHTKRLFALFAALVLCLGMLPAGAMAASDIGNTQLTVERYYTWDGISNIVSDNGTTRPTDTGYVQLTYDTTDGYTLTLHNFKFEGNTGELNGSDYYAVYAINTGLTIALEGENSVTCTGNRSSSYGIYIDGAITFTGSGSLTATGGTASTQRCGIYSHSGGITMAGTGTVTGIGGNSSDSSRGVYANGGTIIVSSGTLKGEGGSGGSSYGVEASGITVTGGALTGQGGQASAYSCGVRAGGTIQVSDSGTLTGTGGQVTGSSGSSCGVYAHGAIEVGDSGSLTGTGGQVSGSNVSSYGVTSFYGSISVTGGTLEGAGGTATEGASSCGIDALNNITVTAGEVTGTGGTADGNSYGLSVGRNGTITLNGGHTVAKGNNGAVNKAPTIATTFDYAWRTSEETETYTLGSETSYGYSAEDTYLEVLPASEVIHPVTGVTLNTDALTLGQGDRETLTATVSPANATNQNVTWTSSDTDVATVSTSGRVTAVAPGEAVITVTTTDGGKTAQCTVTVVPKTAHVEPSGQVGYLVEHYLEGRDGYELEETEIFYDEIGATVTATPKDYAGYTYNAARSADTATGTLTNIEGEEDIVILKLYYDQRIYVPPVTPTYQPTVPESEGGTVDVSPSRPEAGDTVTVAPQPDPGQEVASVTVTDRNDREVEVIDNGDGTYSFTQPTGSVTITVTFQPVQEEPVEPDTPWVNTFGDVGATDWYYSAVEYVCQNGLMVGTSAATFEPTGTVTRGTVTTILARLAGVDTAGSQPWYQTGTIWAVSAGVSDGTDPEGLITREQVAAMLYRYAGEPAVSGDFLAGFADADGVSSWARDAMDWAVSVGILQGGDNGLDAQGTASRAELAAMLMRFCENVIG